MHPLAESARQLLDDIRRGRGGNSLVPFDGAHVRSLRERFNMSQQEFAWTFGFSLSSIRNWEYGQRCPESSARVMLAMIAEFPDEISDLMKRFSTPNQREKFIEIATSGTQTRERDFSFT